MSDRTGAGRIAGMAYETVKRRTRQQSRTIPCALLLLSLATPASAQVVTVRRIDARPPGHPLDSGSDCDPILDDALRKTIGTSSSSATGACVIRVPAWIPEAEKTHPSAKYYLYYSAHHGTKIKMAWSASITVSSPGISVRPVLEMIKFRWTP